MWSSMVLTGRVLLQYKKPFVPRKLLTGSNRSTNRMCPPGPKSEKWEERKIGKNEAPRPSRGGGSPGISRRDGGTSTCLEVWEGEAPPDVEPARPPPSLVPWYQWGERPSQHPPIPTKPRTSAISQLWQLSLKPWLVTHQTGQMTSPNLGPILILSWSYLGPIR
jgi:hypothetical protein